MTASDINYTMSMSRCIDDCLLYGVNSAWKLPLPSGGDVVEY